MRIVIFAKAPRAGQAKTRLIPALGADGAAALAQRMLAHTVSQALVADVGAVELCRADPEDPSWPSIDLPTARLQWGEQGEGDLGERMARACRRVVDGGEAVLLVGTDCPALDAARLRGMARAMAGADVTLIPATDGGYVAIGLTRFHPALFRDIAWSTDRVTAQTRARVVELGWRLRELDTEHDIDEPADLAWLPPGWRSS